MGPGLSIAGSPNRWHLAVRNKRPLTLHADLRMGTACICQVALGGRGGEPQSRARRAISLPMAKLAVAAGEGAESTCRASGLGHIQAFGALYVGFVIAGCLRGLGARFPPAHWLFQAELTLQEPWIQPCSLRPLACRRLQRELPGGRRIPRALSGPLCKGGP